MLLEKALETEAWSPLLYIVALGDQSQYAVAKVSCPHERLMSAANDVASCVRRFMSVGA